MKEFIDEPFEKKDYFQKLNLEEARIMFKKRAKMMQYVKFNFSSDPQYRSQLWQCNGCKTNIDSMSHIIWCPAYSNLREDKDINCDKDLAKYLLQVLKLGENLTSSKTSLF